MGDLVDANATDTNDSNLVVIADTTTATQRAAVTSENKLSVDRLDRSGSGTLTALDTTVEATTSGLSTVGFIITGTWVGTIAVQGSIDGTNFVSVVAVGTGQSVYAATTTNDGFRVSCGCFAKIRVKMTAYTSGTASVTWAAGVGPGLSQVWNTNATSLKVEATARAVDDDGNSTSTPLGISGVFTGTWRDVSAFAAVSFSVFADQASASGGLSIQWSGNGTTADITDNSDVSASTGRGFSLTPRSKYFRVVYTNGTTGQTTFRLYAVLHYNGSGLISRLLSSTITDNNFAQIVRGITQGKKADGSYGSAGLTANSDLKVSDGLRNGGVYGALTLTTAGTTYEAKVGGSRLANRKVLTIVPDHDMYWGYDSSVTTSTGTPLSASQPLIFDIDPDSTFQVWLVAANNSRTARITESP